MAIISVFVILLSIVIFCLETLPEFKHYTLHQVTNNTTLVEEDEVPDLTGTLFALVSIYDSVNQLECVHTGFMRIVKMLNLLYGLLV